jgi:hypothetical protein
MDVFIAGAVTLWVYGELAAIVVVTVCLWLRIWRSRRCQVVTRRGRVKCGRLSYVCKFSRLDDGRGV